MDSAAILSLPPDSQVAAVARKKPVSLLSEPLINPASEQSNCSGVTVPGSMLGRMRSSSSWLVVRLINALFCAARHDAIAARLAGLHGKVVQVKSRRACVSPHPDMATKQFLGVESDEDLLND